MKLTLYHGTSAANARQIEKDGFITDQKNNWKVKSKPGFIYLSSAYGPFYAMNCKNSTGELGLVKVEFDTKNAYPEDDFIMYVLKKPKYTEKELKKVDFEKYKYLAEASLKFMGNIAIKPEHCKILGIRCFYGKNLIFKCDPCITPLNFQVMGEYYKNLSHWIYSGKPIMKFPNFMDVT